MIRPMFAVFVVATTFFVTEGYPGGYPMSRHGMTSGMSPSGISSGIGRSRMTSGLTPIGTSTAIGRSWMTGRFPEHIEHMIPDIEVPEWVEEFLKNVAPLNMDVNMLDHRASGRFGVDVDGMWDFLNAIAGLSEIVGGIIGIGGDEE